MTSPHQYPGFCGGALERFANGFGCACAFHERKAGSTRGNMCWRVVSRPTVQQDIRCLEHVVDVVDHAHSKRHRDRIEPSAFHGNSSKTQQRYAGRRVA